jgi:hypothetical protein
MPHRRAPIRRHDDEPPADAQHSVDVTQRVVEICQILKRLHRKNDIELGVSIRRRCDIRLPAFDPSELGTASFRYRNLVGTDIDGADLTRRPDKSAGLMRVIAASATQL